MHNMHTVTGSAHTAAKKHCKSITNVFCTSSENGTNIL